MQELMIFRNEKFGEIRTLEINNEPYFVAKDICEILEIKNSRQALTRLEEDEKADVILNDGSQNRNMSAVNEYGLYNLILASRKKEAKEFKRWITHEVIPSIRKHGGYIAGQEQMTDEELMAKAVLMANSKIQELNHKNQQLEMQNSQLTVVNEIMKPKAEYFDDLVDRNLLTSFRETAKTLGVKEKVFVSFLLEHKYVFRDKKGKLQPFAEKNKGLFELKETKNDKTGWVGNTNINYTKRKRNV